MSAAEPADPVHASMNARGGGAVIDITKRRRGGALQSAQGRWTTMDIPPGPTHGSGPEQSLRLFAEDIEKSFREINQTLTDDDTASTFVRTLQIFERALEGSCATGLINGQQLAELVAVIRGMQQAPRLV